MEKINYDQRKEGQKLRENQVLDKISQIWKEMNVTYNHIHGNQPQQSQIPKPE